MLVCIIKLSLLRHRSPRLPLVFLFTKLGARNIPTMDEGDFAMQMTLPAGSSLTQSIEISNRAEKMLMDKFPEIRHVVAKIGTAEVPTDPIWRWKGMRIL